VHKVTTSKSVPRDVITMHSRVRVTVLESGEELVYKIVFPREATFRRARFPLWSGITFVRRQSVARDCSREGLVRMGTSFDSCHLDTNIADGESGTPDQRIFRGPEKQP
jgi:hypothetical protein